jgi:enoyl-CoA hydratase/carnithine racemase
VSALLSSEDGDVLSAVEDGVAWIRINRPERANALGREQYELLRLTLVAADEDPRVQVVVLGATGKHFCAGGDLKDLQHVFDDPRAYVDTAFGFYSQFLTMQKLVVAMVQGGVFTVGAIAVAGCDMIVASEDSFMCLPEIDVGLWEPYTVSLLSASIGLKRTKRMLLTGERVPAGQLRDFGLYDEVVARDDLEATTRSLAKRLVATSPTGRAAYKKLTNQMLAPWDIRVPIECLRTGDAREGVAAFVEGREPYWRRPSYWDETDEDGTTAAGLA